MKYESNFLCNQTPMYDNENNRRFDFIHWFFYECWSIFFFNTENNPKDIYLKVCFLFSVFYSEDGFYTTWVKAPSEGGQWSVEAVSMSPFHGLRKAQSQPLLRTMPISVAIEGIPSSLKRAEILRNVTIRTRNNMPVPMQVRTHSTIYHHNVPHTSYNVCSLMWKKLQLYFFS